MPNLPWVLTISLAVGTGTINVLDFCAGMDRPHPEADESKFQADLDAGFSLAEAQKMMKARRRAARHQRSFADKPNLKLEDLPRSWVVPKERTLRPGWLEEKEAARLARKRAASQPAGKGKWARGCEWHAGPSGPKPPPKPKDCRNQAIDPAHGTPAPEQPRAKKLPPPPPRPRRTAESTRTQAPAPEAPLTPPKQTAPPRQPPYPPAPSRFSDDEWRNRLLEGRRP